MTEREALKLALKALEIGLTLIEDFGSTEQLNAQHKAITAIYEALAQPEHEPVACDCDSPSWCKQYKKCNRKMLGFMPYVAQPQRTWVGLTDEERKDTLQSVNTGFVVDASVVALAIEAKLKEKNT